MTVLWTPEKRRPLLPDWPKLYRERSQRLKRLIELDAPEVIVYMAAKTLLKTEFHNSTRRMLWDWFCKAVRQRISSFKSELGIRRLQHSGWSRPCAIDIYFGDPQEHHSKSGCECNAEFEALKKAMGGR